MRATTSRKRRWRRGDHDRMSMPWAPPTSTWVAGAISDAIVSTTSRERESFTSRSGAGSSRERIDGCSAAAPHTGSSEIQPASSHHWPL